MFNFVAKFSLPRLLFACLMLAGAWPTVAGAACTTQGCVMAGPRLASVDSTQSELLNVLLGGLTGTSIQLSTADWSTLASGDIEVADMLEALQTQFNTSTPEDSLDLDLTLLDVLDAAAAAAIDANRADIAGKLNSLAVPLGVLVPTIKLRDLLGITNAPGNSTLNVLDLVTGVVQLYNEQNVASTPAPIAVTTANILGLTGVTALSIAAQVIEPPVFVCGPTGTQFHTASIRLKVNITIPAQSAIVNPLNGILNVTASSVTLLNNFSLYIELARAEGTITSLTAAATSIIGIRAIPGVADLYLGSIPDATFFNRTRSLDYSDFQPVLIGNLTLTTTILLVTTNVTGTIKMRSHGRGQAPSNTDFTLSSPFPKQHTVDSGAAFLSNLLTDLSNNLEITVTLDVLPIAGLDQSVAALVKPLVSNLLSPVLTTVLQTVVDPLLAALGIKLGEAVITAYGVYTLCSVSGSVYDDANHSSVRELAETGTGLTLYAKLVATGDPTKVYMSAEVNTATGAFNFTNVVAEGYDLLIDTNDTTSDVTATQPMAWIATETPTLVRSFTLTTADLTDQTYGLYHGSFLTGRVFGDTGVGGGTANNIARDGAEPSIPGVTVSVTDNAGTATHDTTVSGNDGVYTLWIPAGAGATTLKVVAMNLPGYSSIGASVGDTAGTYTHADDTVTFTNVLGAAYGGVNFADVPTTQFDTDGLQTIVAGNVAFYPHTFTAGTAGQITFAGTAPAVDGWTHEIFDDANCNGAIDNGEQPVAPNLPVTPAQKLCLLVKVYAPVTAAVNEQYPLSIGATFAYANSALSDALLRNDLTVIGTPAGAGLHLVKSVDKTTAKPGDVLVYTITYSNHSSAELEQIRIFDATPAYTVFASAACGTLASGLTACSLTAQPTAGTAGSIEWTLSGTMSPGATGTVTLQVTLQ